MDNVFEMPHAHDLQNSLSLLKDVYTELFNLIDENPQVDAPKYQLKGTEENMELVPIERTQYSYSYVCPHCHCDDYLVDLQNTL